MLPTEIFLFEVVKFLPIRDILRLEQTGKDIRDGMNDNFWRQVIGKDFSTLGTSKKDYSFLYTSIPSGALRGFNKPDELEKVLTELLGFEKKDDWYISTRFSPRESRITFDEFFKYVTSPRKDQLFIGIGLTLKMMKAVAKILPKIYKTEIEYRSFRSSMLVKIE